MYTSLCVNNSLCMSHPVIRLFPVLPGNGRITQDDLVVGGYFIPKGVSVMVTFPQLTWAQESVTIRIG